MPGMQARAPGIDWKSAFAAVGVRRFVRPQSPSLLTGRLSKCRAMLQGQVSHSGGGMHVEFFEARAKMLR